MSIPVDYNPVFRDPVCVVGEEGASCARCHLIPSPEGYPKTYWCDGYCAENNAFCPALKDLPQSVAYSPKLKWWVITLIALASLLSALAIGLGLGTLINKTCQVSVTKVEETKPLYYKLESAPVAQSTVLKPVLNPFQS